MKFSVAMSVYAGDRADQFDRALQSITDQQTVKPSQVVLIVDGPVGRDIQDVISKYEARLENFKTIRLEVNQGLGNALRLAVEQADYDWIARMDSDDVAVPTRFEQQIKHICENDGIDIVGGDISEFIGDEGNVVSYRLVPTDDEEIKQFALRRCPFNHATVMYRKEAVLKAGGYLDLFWNEDYYLWIRMWLCGASFANTGTVLVNVRTGSDMYARRGGRKYFVSEHFLQKYMLKHGMIGRGLYLKNVLKRWIVQRLLPNKLRGWVFRRFARSEASTVQQA